MLTRWRLSNFDLHVETGRYHNIPRNQRVCTLCRDGIIEDENHVIFACTSYNDIQCKYRNFINRSNSIQKLLNHKNIEDYCLTANRLAAE